ncbi:MULTISPECIES: response regulator [unclassified Rhizobium]|uniref:response regulator n=1 Tax=unclassified Rhizobium TaxID=2613769 RepID=UPI00247849D9|nr:MULTISPECIES: response regulator [unclassified Rhizobium]MDH7804158.1 response regulator of citrate/malate metabolism [Rhizobium sp. AN70]
MSANVLQNEQGFRTEQPRVLIVEDEFLIAMDIEDSILQADEEADVIGIANRLDEAVALGSRADIAFVDVNLADGQTGPEIGRRLSQDHGVVVIFMTANPEAVLNLGIGAGVIAKPVPQDAVEQCLAYALARRSGTHAIIPIGMMAFD